MPEPRTVVLEAADLDLLELALALPGIGLSVDAGTARLTDSERTPVAEAVDGVVRRLRPLAPRPELAVNGVVALDDPALAGAEAGVVFDALPTRAQVSALDAVGRSAPIAWFALTGRARTGTGAAPLLRAVAAAAAAWSARNQRAAPVAALPWSLGERPTTISAEHLDADGLADLLGDAYGLEEVVVLGEGDEHRALLSLEEDAAGAARALFPAEVLPFHRAERAAGAVVLLTGLPGSGKSTIARAVAAGLRDRPTSVLDGDEVRQLLSAGLGFSPEDRATNVRRIGWVATEVARAGGIAIAAPIAPFAAGRAEVRRRASAAGLPFLLVHVATPVAVCEARDRKGHYAAARAGELPDFTGVHAPYEAPVDADLVVDTADVSAEEAAARVLARLSALVG